jgi:hypothetical protein
LLENEAAVTLQVDGNWFNWDNANARIASSSFSSFLLLQVVIKPIANASIRNFFIKYPFLVFKNLNRKLNLSLKIEFF